LDTFISDTLQIQVARDSSLDISSSPVIVTDSRTMGKTILGIRQTKKYKYIPVDQYLAMDQSLSDLFQAQFLRDSLDLAGNLDISQLILWTDNSAVLQKGLCLNAYSTFYDTLGQPVSDWLWELRIKREKKEKEAPYLSRVVQELLKQQSLALANRDFHTEFYPYLYRRQLMSWSEVILFEDGYAINAHFTLDFPPDQELKWQRGSPGLYYRKSHMHESIAIGGYDQQWYQRVSQSWIAKSTAALRIGFNNFEQSEFTHVDYQNLLLLHVSTQLIFEYRPIYHKGLYGGVGLLAGYNILPDIINQFEVGFLVSMGIVLP